MPRVEMHIIVCDECYAEAGSENSSSEREAWAEAKYLGWKVDKRANMAICEQCVATRKEIRAAHVSKQKQKRKESDHA